MGALGVELPMRGLRARVGLRKMVVAIRSLGSDFSILSTEYFVKDTGFLLFVSLLFKFLNCDE